MAAADLPVHIPTAQEGDAHIVQRITNEGQVMIRDANNDELRQMRLGLADVGGTLALVVIGDP